MGEIRVLIIDDEAVIREGVQRALRKEYTVAKAENGEQGIEMIKQHGFQIVLLDLMMPGMDGFAVLDWIKENRPEIEVIVITGFATVSKAVSAMKQGAFDFVGKPFTPDYIRIVVGRATERIRLEEEAKMLRAEHSLNLAAIESEQSRLKTVFGCMVEAVVITDSSGVVVHHNPAAIKILEIQTDPFIGKPLKASIQDDNAVAMVQQAIENTKVVSKEFPPGTISRKYLRAHCAPVTADHKTVIGSVTVFEDISTHKQIDQMKSDFVAMVAHELKSPLASVEQMIYALQLGCEYEAEQACSTMHNRIKVRTRDLLGMIDNLLNLSRMENGTVEFNLEPIQGDEILHQILDIITEQAEGKHITINYTPSEVEWWFSVDYDHIRTAFMNIISNAVKYTPEGGQVNIRTSIAGGFANILIKDSGIGISKEDLPHIFDRFFRVKGKATRHITGSGLGLSLVKEVVEAHQGYIDVHSELGAGTEFTLSFPLASPATT